MHFGYPQLPNYSTILRGTFKEHLGLAVPQGVDILSCCAIMTKGIVFRYTWVYSKEDTMAHTRRAVVTG